MGRSFEYRVIKWLRSRGYDCIRSYGSKGVFDIIASKKDKVYGIQAKSLSAKNKAYLKPKDVTELNLMVEKMGLKYELEVYAGKPGKTKTVTVIPTDILHMYNDRGIKTRKLMAVDQWIDFKL